MPERFRITVAQLNPIVGDVKTNAAKAYTAWIEGRNAGANLVATSEMFISGYNAQDLSSKPAFQSHLYQTICNLAAECSNGPTLAVGGPYVKNTNTYNAYYFLKDGQIQSIRLKHHLPNETVFDEKRIFSAGPLDGPVRIENIRIGPLICEDAWHGDVAETLAETGAEFFLVPNGSPYYRGKFETRLNHMVTRVIETELPLIYINMVGGQDDQVFDGGSFALNPSGKLAFLLPVFEEKTLHIDLERLEKGWWIIENEKAILPNEWEQDYRAMVMALRDYLQKSGFKKVILGLSGGIDSALVATIAVDAIGSENVRSIMLPSQYTSNESLTDAQTIVHKLGCHYDQISISLCQDAVTNALASLFKETNIDITEENIQSRLRGLLLMAVSNKFNEMLLTTGNKSEIAVGYSTIYGDMTGGYNPIKDLYKTRVFEIAKWRNGNHRKWMDGPAGTVIPKNIIEKEPTAELRLNQKDSDSLPGYATLDAILNILIDKDGSIEDCTAAGFSHEMSKKIEHLIYTSEYKRYQASPGTRLSERSFWLDRRYPLVNHWRDPTGE
ncbi:MAG: NAD+ synthase [Aestuariivita sp.]|nr:NAD+ synthase [Aestuariivita sp.]